jgi:hypothetical protein
MRLRSIRWHTLGTAPDYHEWTERYRFKCWLEDRGATVTGWMTNWGVRW